MKDKVTLQITLIFRLVKLFEMHSCKILIKVGTNQQMMHRLKLEERGCAEICEPEARSHIFAQHRFEGFTWNKDQPLFFLCD
jgi:hypothetical protein